MRELFREFPEACDNTLRIAEMSDSRVPHHRRGRELHPQLPDASGGGRGVLVRQGGSARPAVPLSRRDPRRCPEAGDSPGRRHPADGLPGATSWSVSDYIEWAKEQDIRRRGAVAPVPVRWSPMPCASPISILSSTVCLFERFLNPDRVSMPDFDVDFDDRRRGEVIEYVERKYGDDRIAQVITYGVMKTKNSLKDASRVLEGVLGLRERVACAMRSSPYLRSTYSMTLAAAADRRSRRRSRAWTRGPVQEPRTADHWIEM